MHGTFGEGLRTFWNIEFDKIPKWLCSGPQIEAGAGNSFEEVPLVNGAGADEHLTDIVKKAGCQS